MRSDNLRPLSAGNFEMLAAWAEEGIICLDGSTLVGQVFAHPIDLTAPDGIEIVPACDVIYIETRRL